MGVEFAISEPASALLLAHGFTSSCIPPAEPALSGFPAKVGTVMATIKAHEKS
jgi:hypothetical protein